MQAAVNLAHAAGVPIWFEPVSVPKSVRASKVLGKLTYISPNAHELIAMALAVDPTHNCDLAQQLLLHMAAGSAMPAAQQLKLLSPFLLLVLQVRCICHSQVALLFISAVLIASQTYSV